MLRGLITFCLLRRALVLIAFVAFLGLGLVAFTALNIEASENCGGEVSF